MKNILIILIALTGFTSVAQQKPDTVIVDLANSSRVVFTIKDRKDITILRRYDFQAMFTDILNKIDGTNPVNEIAVISEPDSIIEVDEIDEPEIVTWDNNNDDDADWYKEKRDRYSRRTRHSVNFDLGTNNYLMDGKFPDDNNEIYSVRPWGSWYVAINSVQRTRVASKFFIEWGMGLSSYNFKFQKDNIAMTKDEDGVFFTEDPRDVNFIKSKLTATFLNASFIPMLDFGGRGKKTRFWDSYGSQFRIGVGPYAGYRIGSHSKLVYKDDGKEKEKNRESFYLNNFRYGLRVQLGIRSTDIFFNYDLNELFSSSKPNNPKLNAFSFGFIF